MPKIHPKVLPEPEAITWNGPDTNEFELYDLVLRARPFLNRPTDGMGFFVNDQEPELGLHIYRLVDGEALTLNRIEQGNTLVFDPFNIMGIPIFVMTPEEFAAFYSEEPVV